MNSAMKMRNGSTYSQNKPLQALCVLFSCLDRLVAGTHPHFLSCGSWSECVVNIKWNKPVELEQLAACAAIENKDKI